MSILAEVTSPNFDQRFDACVAVSATIWGYGLRMCRDPSEVRRWMNEYLDHLGMTRAACLNYRGEGSTDRVRGGPQIKFGQHVP